MARTHAGHYRRIVNVGVLDVPANRRSSLYGYVTNYRTREVVSGLPLVAAEDVISPTSGDAALDVSVDAQALVAVSIQGRGQFPGDALAGNRTRRSGPAALITIAGTTDPRKSGAAGPSPAKLLEIDWDDGGAESTVDFGDEAVDEHTYTDPGTYNPSVLAVDALGRRTVATEVEVTAS